VLRDTTAQRTIGGGKFLDLRAPARKRRSPERLAQLSALALSDPAAALASLLDRPPCHVDFSAFACDRALSDADAAAAIKQCGAVEVRTANATLALSAATWLRLKVSLSATLEQFHVDHPDLQGISVEALRRQLQPRLPGPAFIAILQDLVRSGE